MVGMVEQAERVCLVEVIPARATSFQVAVVETVALEHQVVLVAGEKGALPWPSFTQALT